MHLCSYADSLDLVSDRQPHDNAPFCVLSFSLNALHLVNLVHSLLWHSTGIFTIKVVAIKLHKPLQKGMHALLHHASLLELSYDTTLHATCDGERCAQHMLLVTDRRMSFGKNFYLHLQKGM